MKRWILRVLLAVMVMTALIGTAAAEEVTTPGGVKLILNGSAWTVAGSTGVKVDIPAEYDGKPVTAVQASAFENKGITSVTIPSSVETIGPKAFFGTKLGSLQIPGTVKTIGESAFEQCLSLKTVEFLDTTGTGSTTIGNSAFSTCTGLTTLKLTGTVTSIGNEAFKSCSGLKEVIIWNGTNSVGIDAFYMCDGLTQVAIGKSVGVSDGAFRCKNLTQVHYEGTKFPNMNALPNGFLEENIHQIGITRSVGTATCTESADIVEIVTCQENGCSFSRKETLTVPALGHDLTKTLQNADEQPSAPCADWTKVYEVACTRAAECGYVPSVETEFVPGNGEHSYGEKQEDPDRTQQPVGCKWPGTKYFYQECELCGEKELLSETEEIQADPHQYEDSDTPRTVVPATCTRAGITVIDRICSVCGSEEKEECDECEKYEKEGIEAYIEHLETVHNGQPTSLAEHTWSSAQDVVTTEPSCENETDGELTIGAKVCTVCGEVDDTGCKTETIKWAHTPDPEKEISEETAKEATCTVKGIKTVTAFCKVCGQEFTVTEELEMLPHTPDKPTEIVRQATCTEPGEKIVPASQCTVCGTKLAEGSTVSIPALGHDWGPFQETASASAALDSGASGESASDAGGAARDGETSSPTSSCGAETKVHGFVQCTRCGETMERTITIPASGKHTYPDEWTTVKEPTDTEDGLQQRVCTVCGHVDTQVLPATGSPSTPDTPSDPSNPSNPSNPDTTAPSSYNIEIISSSNGVVTSSVYTARRGSRITLTVQPNSGYELNWIRVTTDSGSVVSLNGIGGGQYRFTMPSSAVEVRSAFTQTYTPSWAANTPASTGAVSRWTDPSQTVIQSVPRAGASGQVFSDIPVTYWAAGEINWASAMGYMSGSGGRFNPDGTITFQQMWMVLARISGSRPSNMTEARNWAVLNGFAEGGNPTNSVVRHQLVTALYRTAHILGSTNNAIASLASYPDSRLVPAVARDSMAWAVANGIISGNANGRLDPFGTLTRAQFAVILYRFFQRV